MRTAGLLLLVLVLPSGGLEGQVTTGDTLPPPPAADTVPAAGDPELGEVPGITPGGAFLRSVVLPGWGHAATGSHFRGAFYVAVQSSATWMLVKSLSRRNEAERFRRTELELARERLGASGIVGADSVRVLAEGDPRVEEWDVLVEERSQQVEDWAALSIFFLLLGAADAFVAGHLMDPPEALTVDVLPALNGGWELRLSVRSGLRRPRF